MEKSTKYQFRALCASDMFPMFSILDKIGIKEFKECFRSGEIVKLVRDRKANYETIGISIALDIASVVMKNLKACERDIYMLLSSVSDLSEEEIKALSMAEFAEMIIDFVKLPDFADFFKAVSKLFK